MKRQFDAVTIALTGQLAYILIGSTILALAASYLILRLYRRAVIKSMRRRSRSDLLEGKGFLPPEAELPPHETPLEFTFVTRASASKGDAARLYRTAVRRQWLAAGVQVIAGSAFAATMTAAFFVSSKLPVYPFSFMYFTWAHAWPVLIALDAVAWISRGAKRIGSAIYLSIGIALGAVLLVKNPGVSLADALYIWLDLNAIPTLLLLIFLNRRIRAVGPLVLIFMILGMTGASLAVTFTGVHPKFLKAFSDFSRTIGLGPRSAITALHLFGFLVFAAAGWILLEILRSLYVKKYVSEQSITIDAVWLIFGIVNSIGLVFEGRLWILSGLGAFIAYKLITAGLLRAGTAQRSRSPGPRLLLLRVFALGRRSERLYDALGKFWRTVGSLQMIAGPDLATTAIEPHEFLDFMSGRLARRFIDSGGALDLRIDQLDLKPDGEGQFRVTEFFCHDDMWKLTLARLAGESDAVLMDLRGFGAANAGCIFEINEIFELVPLPRVVFAVDRRTDQDFMRRTMRQAWRQIKERSPNRRLASGQVALVDLSQPSTGTQDLLYAVGAAAAATP